MGCLFFFDEEVTLDNEPRVRCTPHQVQVLKNHGVPEVVIGPIDGQGKELFATFHDWQQFERFVDAVNELHTRLKSSNQD